MRSLGSLLVLALLIGCGAGPERHSASNLPEPSAKADVATADENSEKDVDYDKEQIATTPDFPAEWFEERREAMVNEDLARDYSSLNRPAIKDQMVLDAFRRVPREKFVPAMHRGDAYGDHPLPIGHGQTISQPYMVAVMTELAEIESGEKVLEIGTGSGYQAAILAELTEEVYTIELLEPLGRTAEERLRRLGYDKVRVRIGDGYAGWPEEAPFDAIIVTAAPDEVPRPLVEQLAPGGRLVIPVGPQGGTQWLERYRKDAEGRLHQERIMGVRFVPFLRGEVADDGDNDVEK